MVQMVLLTEAFGFTHVKPEQIYHADSSNLTCIPTLNKHTFDTTNQLLTHIICMKHALHYG